MKTIVLVDDQESQLFIQSELLKKRGYHVLIAKTGEDALRLTRENNIDVVIADVQMSPMDGFELTYRLRNECYPLRIIVMSADGENKSNALASGADVFYNKMGLINNLANAVKQVLKSGKSIQ